jgi:hypothetical protein
MKRWQIDRPDGPPTGEIHMDKQTTIIEIGGVKLEVDLRSAKRIDELKIGSRVKCLQKPSYGEMKTLPGVIVGFEPFPSLPTGVFRWRVPRGGKPAGSIAGCKHKVDGRIYIGIDGRLYKAHRLAWLYVHGEWPPAGIDHRDTIVSHNWIDNLRPATQAQNMQNIRRPHRDNKTGFLGVQRRSKDTWCARLKCGPLFINSIQFPTPEEAHAAYLRIKSLFHPFATTGAPTWN